MELSYPGYPGRALILPAQTRSELRRIPQEFFLKATSNKFFIDQACSVKVTGYWPRSFFGETKHAKKN